MVAGGPGSEVGSVMVRKTMKVSVSDEQGGRAGGRDGEKSRRASRVVAR
jgi:hypothetical protein